MFLKRKTLYFTLVLITVLSLLVVGCSSNSGTTSQTGTNSGSSSNQGSTATKQEDPPEKKLDYPRRALTVVVWGNPGSGTDVMGRTLASVGEKYFGQPIVVVNKPGGSGVTALNYTKTQPADGYTVNVVTATLLSLIAQGKAEMPVMLNKTNDSIEFMVVRADSPFQTFEDMVNYAKENPGKLKIAGSLAGSYGHQFTLDVSNKAGIEVNYIPYDGTSETLTAVLSGEVDVASGGGNFGPQIASGTIRALAANVPAALFPDIPVLDDLGIPNSPQNWRAISVKPGTDPEIVEYLHNFLKQTFESDEWRTYLEQSNEDYIYMPSEELQAFAESQVDPTREYLKSVGLME